MVVVRKITEMPYKSIGKEFGGKNYATVIYSCNNVEKLCATDEVEDKKIETIMKNLINK